MLSRFSCVWLFVTPWTAAHHVPLSMRFSRQECSVLPYPPHVFLFPSLLSILLLLLSRFNHVNSVRPCRRPSPRPWDSPGKNTGVGCHFLLKCMKVKSEGEVAQSCLTLHDPMDCSLPGSSIRGILQVRVMEWGATAFSFCYCHIMIRISRYLNIFTWIMISSSSVQNILHQKTLDKSAKKKKKFK